MISPLRKLTRKVHRWRDLAMPHDARVRKWGHRRYVGGANAETWYGAGKHQYHYLVSQGLRPDHTFLDIACGSLRLGQYLIPFLEAGHYYGIEGEQRLIDEGRDRELLFDIEKLKTPNFSVNYDFDFSFIDTFDMALAQSLFTHLVPADIEKCFVNLSTKRHEGSRFFFTFFEGNEDKNPAGESHANRNWRYSFETLKEIAERSGWSVDYVGDWGHKGRQMMAVAHL